MKKIPRIKTVKENAVYRIDTRDPFYWRLVANRDIAGGEQLTVTGVSSLVPVEGIEEVEIELEETGETKRIITGISAVPGHASCDLDTLEIPWCFMNHACEPNTFDRWPDDGHPNLMFAETVALRDIAEGEELTSDYDIEYYDYLFPFVCRCGAAACRGTIRGFNGLSGPAKAQLLSRASPFIKLKYEQSQARSTD